VRLAIIPAVTSALVATLASAIADPAAETRETDRKLDSIVIPKIEFKDTPVREAFAFLAQQSKEHDKSGSTGEQGVQFVLKIDANAEATLISLDLENMSLREALRYTCMLAGLKFQADKRVVLVAPLSDPTIAP
jgi:hypothetical protein